MKSSMLQAIIFILGTSLLLSAQAPDVEREVKGWIGQTFILHGYGDQREVKLKMEDLKKSLLRCDSPVEIREACYSRDQLRLTLENIGTVSVWGRGNMRDWCQKSVIETRLIITEVKPGDLASGVAALVVLMTPEAYLASNGVPFSLPPVSDDEPSVTPGPGKTDAKPLLTVNPTYNDEARKARAQGSVTVDVVVGTDGRIHSPNVTKHPGYGLDKQVLRTLSLWRFEPGRQNGQAVALKTSILNNFSLR